MIAEKEGFHTKELEQEVIRKGYLRGVKGVPADVKTKWEESLAKVAADPEFQKFITERMGGTVAPLFGSDLDAFLDEMANVFITTAQNLKKNQ